MHQTFYIDVDEEITSIIDRLRNSNSNEIIIVVPKRALLIQSIVNLKLLKKEAQNMGKQIMIVTQDKLGKLLVEKTGILVQQKLNDLDEAEEEEISRTVKGDKGEMGLIGGIHSDPLEKRRMDTIGSSEYFEEGEKKNREFELNPPSEWEKDINLDPKQKDTQEEKITNKELVTEAGIDMNKASRNVLAEENQSNTMVKNMDIRQSDNPDFMRSEEIKTVFKKTSSRGKDLFKKEALPENNSLGKTTEKLTVFFNHPANHNGASENFPMKLNREKALAHSEISLSKKIWKTILIFGGMACVVIVLAAAYLFLPKAQVKLFAKIKQQSAEAVLKGDINISEADLEKQQIPLRLVKTEEEILRTYTSTGSKSSTNQKARGMITVYNEYSVAPQPLVATTRFLNEEGKIFRLIKSITVPGVTQIGGETKPGAIEAEVIADESGESFNIGPSQFTIPGFQNSGADKYAKFYGKSFKSMSGGGNGTQGIKTVSASDITIAKNKALSEITEAIKVKIKESAGDGMVVLDEAIDMRDSIYTLSSMEGEAAETFTVSVKTKASAFVFKEDDLRNVFMALILKNGGGTSLVNNDSFKVEFGKSEIDLAGGTLIIKAQAKAMLMPNINIENLKKGILGKDEGGLESYLKTYPDIERVEVEYWPSFISGKIPSHDNRVVVELAGF